jgi:sigma-B regulation protein RsbU (phosphoserine phosphatase)
MTVRPDEAVGPPIQGAHEGRSITVLLIDDQAIVGEAVRRMLAPQADVQFHFCQDATKAIATANAVQPTVILQDLVMPDIDGLMLVKFFRANPATQQTPMIVLSSKEEPTIKAQAFALGANDYLVKLPDPVELIARVRYHSRSYIAQLERDEAYRQLAERERLMAEELAQAAHYVQSLLPPALVGEVKIDWRFVPSTQLGGDMFGFHWLDPEHLAVYLLDVSGHGVGSSLLAVSAANLLSAQSLPDTDCRNPGQVIAKLNDVFQMEKQNDKYFTIWYGIFQKRDRVLAYCNAGHPPPLLWNGPSAAESTLHQLKSTGPGVGMLPAGLEFETQTIPLQHHAHLLVYSDGAFEIHLAEGGMWQFEQFVAYLCALPRGNELLCEPLLTHVKELCGTRGLVDDCSILEIRL